MASAIELLIAKSSTVIPSAIEQIIQNTEKVDVDSSFIDSVSYDATIKVLTVDINGTRYSYYNVPQFIYDRMVSGGSPGAVLNKVIKQGFFPFSRG